MPFGAGSVTLQQVSGKYCTKKSRSIVRNRTELTTYPAKRLLKRTFFDWHSIRKASDVMKWKFTYKTLTLLLGILVAVIILVTLWMKPFAAETSEVSAQPIIHLAVPAAKIALKHTVLLIADFLN